MPTPLTIAVVLSGCGHLDGAEITESVSVLIHLSRLGARAACFAPEAPVDEINHTTGAPTGSTRSALAEAARIARGNVSPLASLRAADFDAVIFPGGFGAAKTLCTFATRGPDCAVHPDAARVISEFHSAGKPIGLCCIAPVLAAKVLGAAGRGPGVSVTLGNDPAVAAAIAAMGATHINKPVTEAHTDTARKVVTTPAYMYDATPNEVFEGTARMVESVLAFCSR